MCIGWSIVVCGLVTLLSCAPSPSTSTCVYKGATCPNYQVKYEFRQYEAATWVMTAGNASTYNSTLSQRMYHRLGHYLYGANVENKTMPMAVPVVDKFMNESSSGVMPYTKWFLVDSDAPAPTDSQVIRVSTPAFSAFVRRYMSDGQPTHEQKLQEVAELKKDIGDVNLYFPNEYYLAGYDHPNVNEDRRNEVLLRAKTESKQTP